MISVGAGDGRKVLGLEMDHFELEEGEALSYHDEDEDSTMDPDIDLSYLEEKIQHVLGHFQKDFEGGVVSAENLGAKYGGYGSFLPSYQRSPSFPHAPPETHKSDAQRSPRKLNVEDRGHSLFALASVSPKRNAGPSKNSCTPKLSEESPSECGFTKKSVNHSDQKTLKVRIKVGTENLSTQKNADIYSGLGLVVTPSSSFDNSPAVNEGKRGKTSNLPEESPTSILQIMTSSPMGMLLSPLPEDLVCLIEKRKVRVKTESKLVDKTSTESSGILVNGSHSSRAKEKVVDQKKPRLSGKNTGPSLKNAGEQDKASPLVKVEKESYPQKDVPKVEKLNVSKGRKDFSGETTNKKKSQKDVVSKVKDELLVDSSASPKSVNPEFLDLQKDHDKPVDVYKDFFGEFEEDDHESISEEKTCSERPKESEKSMNHVAPKKESEKSVNHFTPKKESEKSVNHATPKEKVSIDSNRKKAKNPGGSTHEVHPGPSSEAPIGLEKEEWVCCDKCSEWRLLPFGTDPKSLPDKWLCKMLTWLPGMNRCGIPEAETTNALRALYLPVAPIPAAILSSQHDGLYNAANPVPAIPVIPDTIQEHQGTPVANTASSGKKKDSSSTHSSSSRKKNVSKAIKDSTLDGGNLFPKDTTKLSKKSKPTSALDDPRSSKRMKGDESRENDISTSDNHRSKYNDSKDSRDDAKKKVVPGMHTPGSDGGSMRSSKSNDKDGVRKRKGNRDLIEEMCENDLRKEKKSRTSKSGAKDTDGSKASVGTEKKSDLFPPQHSVAANSSSSKVSGSNKNKQEVKGSPVESVSSSPLRIHSTKIVDKVTLNIRYPGGKGNSAPITDTGIDRSDMGKNDSGLKVSDKNDGSSARKIGNGLYSQSKEKSGTPIKADKLIVKKDLQNKEKPPVKGDQRSNSLPPLAKVQNEDSRSEKQNRVKAVDVSDKGDSSGGASQSKKAHSNQPSNLRHPTPNSRNVEGPSPARKDSVANSAIKEAKDLKHLADRLRIEGSSESSGLYLQSVLKFLHAASLLESGSSEGTKQNESSMEIYSTTAKLSQYCAYEYEKSKDMAGAALAYKCVEVAYMRVVYSGHAAANRDRNELQTSLQIVPPGESPSSSASDVDNLNHHHQATVDKAPVAKAISSPQVSASHLITSRNRSVCSRLLNFAEDVNSAMEASRKSRAAFAAATSRLGEMPSKECISALKKALDFNFQDIEGLLRLVRVAMDTITR